MTNTAHGKVYQWRQPQPPTQEKGSPLRTARPFETCAYCGSMSPANLAAAIQAGARMELADMKYGWPHKWYISGAPNPFAGMMEIRSYKSDVDGKQLSGPEEAAKATTDHGKFYTIHLNDATDEEKNIIARGMGYWITFTDDGNIECVPWVGNAPTAVTPITGETTTVVLEGGK